MAEVELLRALPKGNRNVQARETAKTEEHIRVSREYGEMYFDGPREYGYGGYRYDGRWQPVARDIVDHFGLKPGDKVLDVGCAKGFLVKDLLAEGIDAFGIDVSKYALMNCEQEAIGRLQIGSCDDLPFPDGSFDAVLAINTIHNLDRDGCVRAAREIERLAPGKGFIQVDSYLTPEQKDIFESWVLTARFHDYPDGWLKVLEEAGYTGDWYWTIIG
ncbi:MAG TPA: methyltransferase [Rhodospirillaceae bacterium]|nr:methyltransferase [Rhodospirillaceae bacterium]|tara:strand:+ start:43643 stop:44293 length:651 start_codon:yes stop_codon:yes gene_type:complete